MKKDPLVNIDDIRDSIDAIKRYTAGLAKEDFFSFVPMIPESVKNACGIGNDRYG